MAKFIEKLPRGSYTQLKYNDELMALLPAHANQEWGLLANNIESDGVVRDAIVAWYVSDDEWIVVDGMTRMEYAEKHNVDVEVALYDFDGVDDAKRWIVLNQTGRRNISPRDRAMLVASYAPDIDCDELANLARVSLSTARRALQQADEDEADEEASEDDPPAEECLESYILELTQQAARKQVTVEEPSEHDTDAEEPEPQTQTQTIANKEFTYVEQLKEALSHLRSAEKLISKLEKPTSHVSLKLKDRVARQRIRELKEILNYCTPYETCMYCHGVGMQPNSNTASCRLCGGSGWISEEVYKRNQHVRSV